MKDLDPQDTKPCAFHFGTLLLDALLVAPERCAFRHQGQGLSRGALRERACALAARLSAAGLQPGEAVAIEIAHSVALPVAMCSLQVAGACAVPVDPSLSAQRRAAILGDINPRFILRSAPGAADGIAIERHAMAAPDMPDSDLAFVVYTSGSGGGPKGVMISHESYVRRMQNILPGYRVQDDDIDLAWTPASFTVMIDEIFLPLLAGVPSVIAQPALRTDPMAFAALVQSERITSFRLTPSVLDVLLHPKTAPALSGVRTIICSGEAMPADLQARAHAFLPAKLLGFYGATEAPAVAAIPFERDGVPSDRTICVPQPFVPIRIKSPARADLPPGQSGEIWVGGVALARGYFNRPALSAKKFVVMDGARWYRTGDLGRLLADGRLEVLGRLDLSEVKINGTRINLPEVMATMRAQTGIDAAWVTPLDQAGQRDPVLVAHCVPAKGCPLDVAALRDDLAAYLPAAAIPAVFLILDALPLTDNGKTDAQQLHKRASLHLDAARKARTSLAAKKTPQRTDADPDDWHSVLGIVLNTAEDVLHTPHLGGADSFFASGGDSLRAVHLALLLEERLGCDIRPTLITNAATFGDIAQAICTGQNHSAFAARLIREGMPTETPVFTFNDRVRYEMLAPQLASGAPVWNLDLFGLTEGELSGLDRFALQELAEVFADAVLAIQPTGPWRLIGFCNSACPVIEVARVLQTRTGQVSALLLIDAFFAEFLPTPRVHLGRLLDFGPAYALGKIAGRFGRRVGDIPDRRRAALLEQSNPERGQILQRFRDLCAAYEVTPYHGPVTLFVSRELRHNSRVSILRLAAGGLRVHDVAGLHLSVFQAKNGKRGLAQAIDAELAGRAV